ncbi:cell division suppressor protein YneA [Sporosarcina ureilytica]|uniref:LysM domain-containing protein n=1 Tax=Sporosarcina ureilytica TaxID=298596 RepID=A0A1D8JHN7_9BACL|nr:LysM peptidoglycan-binding domain-containing protein [Sporosarcina ureilytica]AOV08194.1 hypothetical protein BI350_12065 [Sporosarcina ureilytica]
MNFIKKNNYILFVMVLFIIFTVASIKKLEHEVTYEYLTVAEGDTLWGYSEEYAENIPSDKWINEIVKINNLSSTTIKIGEEIRIPVTPQKLKFHDIATNTLEDGK